MKKFDEQLFKDNDERAKKEAIKLFESIDSKNKIFPNRNKYDVDLIIKNNDKVVAYLEVEVKNVWKGKNFPYPNIQFPKRKSKYVKNKKHPVLFMMFNNDLSNFLLVNGEDLINAPLVEVINKYVAKNEFFYQVPVERASFKEQLLEEIENEKKEREQREAATELY